MDIPSSYKYSFTINPKVKNKFSLAHRINGWQKKTICLPSGNRGKAENSGEGLHNFRPNGLQDSLNKWSFFSFS